MGGRVGMEYTGGLLVVASLGGIVMLVSLKMVVLASLVFTMLDRPVVDGEIGGLKVVTGIGLTVNPPPVFDTRPVVTGPVGGVSMLDGRGSSVRVETERALVTVDGPPGTIKVLRVILDRVPPCASMEDAVMLRDVDTGPSGVTSLVNDISSDREDTDDSIRGEEVPG
jgi:hypothetical protein